MTGDKNGLRRRLALTFKPPGMEILEELQKSG